MKLKNILLGFVVLLFISNGCAEKNEIESISLDNFRCAAGDCFESEQGQFNSDVEICFKEPYNYTKPYIKLEYHLKNGTIYKYEDTFFPDKNAKCISSGTRLQFLRGRNVPPSNYKAVRELYKENIDFIRAKVYSDFEGDLITEFEQHFDFEGNSFEELRKLYQSN